MPAGAKVITTARDVCILSVSFSLFFFLSGFGHQKMTWKKIRGKRLLWLILAKTKGPDVDSLFTELGKDSVVGKVFRQPWADSAAAKRDKKKWQWHEIQSAKTDFATEA